jgi:hypothetical protein
MRLARNRIACPGFSCFFLLGIMVKGQGFSSLRNAVKRRTHKERSQPAHRKSLGLLEKKKDYVKRAKDHHKKMDRLRALQEKASMRNPDEFYFKMKNSRTEVSSPPFTLLRKSTYLHLIYRTEGRPRDGEG